MNFDNLTIGEVITLEDMCGVSLSQIEDSKSDGRVLRALVIITAPRGKQAEVTEAMEMSVSLILSVPAYGGLWTVDSVSQPYVLAGETYQLPAVTISVHGPIRN